MQDWTSLTQAQHPDQYFSIKNIPLVNRVEIEVINDTAWALWIFPYPIDHNQWWPFDESKKDLYSLVLFFLVSTRIRTKLTL